MRLTSILLILFVIQMGILIFDNTYTITETSDPYENSSWVGTIYGDNSSSSDVNPNIFWTSMINPASFTSSKALSELIGILLTVTTISTAVFIGLSLTGLRSDLVLKVPLAILFLGAGATPIWQLYNLIIREPSLFGCSAGVVCANAIIVSFFISGILLLLLILGVISWWTGVDTG